MLVVVVDVEVASVGLERLELLYPLLEGDLGHGVREAGAVGSTAVLWSLESEADRFKPRNAIGVELYDVLFLYAVFFFKRQKRGDITPCKQVGHPHKPQPAEPPKKQEKRESQFQRIDRRT